MKATKWLGVVAAVAATLAALYQWRTIADLRFQNGLLRSNQDAPAAANDSNDAKSEEVERLKVENRDLLKLRNEVRQLRSQIPELTAARAESQRLTQATQNNAPQNAPAGVDEKQFTSREALAEAGLATPEAAIQSFFRAMRDGDIHRFLECAAPDFLGRTRLQNKTEAELQQYATKLREPMEGFRNFRIIERKEVSPDEVVLALQSSAGNAIVHMSLQRSGNEWRVDPPF